ncbi:methane monooxygenase/ammonia monooxygenase subunit B [Methylosinus sp. R-45379]|uniref:bacterial ammonia monooxygenase, subunit AmoB n=1 Tax=Methylosinus sp. R-45379 TaxID=980563 RepID=UPI0007C94DB6|nr:bacterial ammonia monooxygenase, subunit AmoB [Methylosinus sp. R-45379]OAI30589.1 methane monooxygenase/ammonia monooxygenase subunit B [Methylosinus sp. R-45379]
MRSMLKCLLAGAGLILITSILWPNGAFAHGEKALEPFVRMRTVQFYDVALSKTNLAVNEEIVMTGKFHVAEDWPRGVAKPDVTYLNVSAPGPVMVRTERYINAQPSVSSFALKLGGDYEFKVVLKGRMPGRFHIHPFFNLHDAGPVMGPGAWIEISGQPTAFVNEVKTLDGSVIDMETYGLANGVGWHVLWIAIGSAWLLWWVRRPLFLPRFKMVRDGRAAELISPLDIKIAFGILFCVPAIVLAANLITDHRYPNAIPLQAALDQIDPLPQIVNAGPVSVRIQRTEFDIPNRAVTLFALIHNRSDQPVSVTEFATANLRFLSPKKDGAANEVTDRGDADIGKGSLTLDSYDPLAPGESRSIRITAADALWQTERLDGLVRDADSRIGGLLFFEDGAGARHIASISSPVIPKFN